MNKVRMNKVIEILYFMLTVYKIWGEKPSVGTENGSTNFLYV